MKKISFAVGGAALFMSAGALAQVASPVPEAKYFQLSKVVLDTETVDSKLRLKGGTLCVFPSTVTLPKKKQTLAYERFDNLFSERLSASGLKVVNISADLFTSDEDKNKADYLLGAIIRLDMVNLCSSAAGEKGDVNVKIEWQLYDRRAGKVVETATTDGRGVQEKFASDGFTRMVNQAFQASLGALIEKGVLDKYARPGS